MNIQTYLPVIVVLIGHMAGSQASVNHTASSHTGLNHIGLNHAAMNDAAMNDAATSHTPVSHYGGILGDELRIVNTPDTSTPHNIHVTYASMVVDKKVVSVQVRYFKHDLEKAVAAFAKRDSVALGTDRSSDSLYVAYVDSTFRIAQDGRQLGARLVGSGEDGEMWWYQIEYEATRPISKLKVTNTQLTESFRDQKNILKAMNMASGVRKSFYYNRKVTEFDITL